MGDRVIRTTAEHPFWVAGRGWVEAHQIEKGNLLIGAAGESIPVVAIDGPLPAETVYNLEIQEYHTYLVTGPLWGFAVWAHNNAGPLDPIPCGADVAPNGAAGKLRDPKTGRYVTDPANPPSTNVMTDAQRRAAWKKLAQDPDSLLTPAQRAEIEARGWRGPRRQNELGEWETMELSHEPIPLREGGTEVVPRWPADHAAVDPHRQLPK